MDMEDTALVADPQLETDLQRLKEEEKVLLQQQKTLEGTGDDIAALENQDILRHNQNQQRAILKRQSKIQRALLQQQLEAAQEHSADMPAQCAAAPVSSLPIAPENETQQLTSPTEPSSVAEAAAGLELTGFKKRPGMIQVIACQASDLQMRRRATCTVRVNNLHPAEAIETDV